MNFDLFKRTEFKLFLTIWLIYIFFINSYGGDYMTDSTLSSTLSLVDKGTFIVDDYVKEGCKQTTGCDYSYYNSHFYSGYAPGMTLLAVPLYIISKPLFYLIPHNFLGYPDNQMKLIFLNFLATIFISSLLSALMTIMVYDITQYFTKNKYHRLISSLVLSFGTLLFIYSTEYYDGTVSTFFIFLSFYLLFKIKNNQEKIISSKLLFLAGLCAGFSVFLKYHQIIPVLFLSIYLLTFLRNKKILYFLAGLIVPGILLLGYHQLIYGNPLDTPYKHRMNDFALNTVSTGFYQIVGPEFKSIYGLSFSPEKGLFLYMPILLLSLIGLFYMFKERNYTKEAILILIFFFGLFLFNSSLVDSSWQGNCSFGPRYLIPFLPFLALPLVFAFNKIKPLLFIFISILSIFINLLGTMYGKTLLWTGGCENKLALFLYLKMIPSRGLSNYTLNLIKEKAFDIPIYLINLITLLSLIFLGLLLYYIWKNSEFSKNLKTKEQK